MTNPLARRIQICASLVTKALAEITPGDTAEAGLPNDYFSEERKTVVGGALIHILGRRPPEGLPPRDIVKATILEASKISYEASEVLKELHGLALDQQDSVAPLAALLKRADIVKAVDDSDPTKVIATTLERIEQQRKAARQQRLAAGPGDHAAKAAERKRQAGGPQSPGA